MSTLPKVIARTISDNPLLVCKRPTKELFVPYIIYHTKTVTEPQSSVKQMPAGKARNKGYDIQQNIADNKLVKIEWVEYIDKEITWIEQRLKARGYHVERDGKEIVLPRRGRRHVTMRAELADACDAPLSLVCYEKLQKLVMDEISHWKNHNMLCEDVRPIVLVLLGLIEYDDGMHKTYPRDIYYIKKFDEYNMIVIDSNDNEIEIQLEKNVYKSGVVSRFIVFLPANVRIFDSVTEDILL